MFNFLSKRFTFKLFPMLTICFGLYGIQGTVSEYKSGSEVMPTGRRRIAMDETIFKLDIDKTPLLLMLNKIGKESTTRAKFEWMTEARPADYISSTAVGGNWAAGANSDGTLTVSTSDVWLFAEGDVLQLPAISQTIDIYVNSVNSSTGVLTCYTVNGNINLSAVGSSYPKILRLGNAFEIGSNRGTIKSQQPNEAYNYIQIFQTPIGITTTADNIAYRGGDEWDRLRFNAGVEHAFEIEKTFFFGQRHVLNTGRMNSTYRQYFTGGVRGFLSSYVTDAGGALTQTEFVDWLVDVTKYAEEPILFPGELLFEAMWQWADGKLQLERSEEMLGMYIGTYVTPYGKKVKFVPHRELLTDQYAGVGFCLDIPDLTYTYLKGKRNLDTHMEEHIETPGDKQRIDEYRTWCGLKLGHEKRHGMLYNITSIST